LRCNSTQHGVAVTVWRLQKGTTAPVVLIAAHNKQRKGAFGLGRNKIRKKTTFALASTATATVHMGGGTFSKAGSQKNYRKFLWFELATVTSLTFVSMFQQFYAMF